MLHIKILKSKAHLNNKTIYNFEDCLKLLLESYLYFDQENKKTIKINFTQDHKKMVKI